MTKKFEKRRIRTRDLQNVTRARVIHYATTARFQSLYLSLLIRAGESALFPVENGEILGTLNVSCAS